MINRHVLIGGENNPLCEGIQFLIVFRASDGDAHLSHTFAATLLCSYRDDLHVGHGTIDVPAYGINLVFGSGGHVGPDKGGVRHTLETPCFDHVANAGKAHPCAEHLKLLLSLAFFETAGGKTLDIGCLGEFHFDGRGGEIGHLTLYDGSTHKRDIRCAEVSLSHLAGGAILVVAQRNDGIVRIWSEGKVEASHLGSGEVLIIHCFGVAVFESVLSILVGGDAVGVRLLHTHNLEGGAGWCTCDGQFHHVLCTLGFILDGYILHGDIGGYRTFNGGKGDTVDTVYMEGMSLSHVVTHNQTVGFLLCI